MWKKWILVLITAVISYQYAYAQIPKLPRIPKFYYDTAYIINYNDHLAVRLVSPHRLYNFSIKNKANNAKYTYRPNLHTGMGVGFTYKWLAIDMTISPDFTSRNNDRYGKTKEFNFAASFYLERNIIDFQFRQYKGFYVSDPQKYLPGWENGMPHPTRPDVTSVALNLSYSIPLNWKRYSLRTTFLLDGMLKKSSGSVVIIPDFYYYHAHADSSMLPIDYEASFTDEAKITNMNFFLFSMAAGYAYTFVVRKFYFTLSAFPAISFNAGNVTSEGGDYGPFPVSFKFISKEGIGYNSPRWYAGFYFVYDINNIQFSNDLAFTNNVGGWRIFVGYRIKPPKALKKLVE